MVPVLLPCNASSKSTAHIDWLPGRGLAYDSRSGPTGIQMDGILRDTFLFLHHMVCCRDFGRKIPAVGCVDDVLDGYFQSAYIVPGLHSTVIPIVDRDESNAQQWKMRSI